MMPTWLLPSGELPASFRAPRRIGDPTKSELARARRARWARSEKGRAYFRQLRADPIKRQKANERSKRWHESPRGKEWVEQNRVRRNHYSLMRYHADPKRREYLNAKQREYRAAKRDVHV